MLPGAAAAPVPVATLELMEPSRNPARPTLQAAARSPLAVVFGMRYREPATALLRPRSNSPNQLQALPRPSPSSSSVSPAPVIRPAPPLSITRRRMGRPPSDLITRLREAPCDLRQ